MKKLLIIVLAFILTACGAAPAQQPQATPIVVTVVVPASPVPQEALPQPTLVPTQIPPTTAPTEVPPTAQVIVVTATSAAAVSAPPAAAGSEIKFDEVLGKGVFTNMTVSENTLTLRCTPREITFNITASLPDITDAIMAYRIVDNPAGLYPSEWQSNIKMKGDGKGNFSIVFGGDDVDENLRLDKAWLDVQFIGLNKGGAAVDRTQKIERMITYYKDCP